jgi:hypothetical protein
MTPQEAVDEILERFNDIWTPTTFPVVWQDVATTPALQKMIDGADGVPLTPYARVTVRSNFRRQESYGQIGNRKFRGFGILFVEIFTPTGDGMKQARELEAIVRNAYEDVDLSTFHVRYKPNVQSREQGSEGLWSRLNVTVEWEYEDRK